MILNHAYSAFLEAIKVQVSSDRVFTDPLHTLAYGTDASFYRLVPKIVIKAVSEKEVQEILRLSNIYKLAITFRAAGTSLSGQAISDSILVICAFGFRGIKVLDDGDAISLEPGVIGSHANDVLKFYNKKIGPDPASISTAAIGGIVANNASGMCCGIDQNSYKTLKYLRVVLQDGTILDTSDVNSIESFRKSHHFLLEQLVSLSNHIKLNPELHQKIIKKYAIKNTTGYSINALIDFEDPIDMLTHLMVGSEGSLGFISNVVFETVSEPKIKASSLIYFEDIHSACEFVAKLKTNKGIVNAAELLDRASLRSVENKEGE